MRGILIRVGSIGVVALGAFLSERARLRATPQSGHRSGPTDRPLTAAPLTGR